MYYKEVMKWANSIHLGVLDEMKVLILLKEENLKAIPEGYISDYFVFYVENCGMTKEMALKKTIDRILCLNEKKLSGLNPNEDVFNTVLESGKADLFEYGDIEIAFDLYLVEYRVEDNGYTKEQYYKVFDYDEDTDQLISHLYDIQITFTYLDIMDDEDEIEDEIKEVLSIARINK